MTPAEYIEKYSGLIKWVIRHKTSLMYDEYDDRFQDVAMVICTKIDKLNAMEPRDAKRYIVYTACRRPFRHTWGNAKFMCIQDMGKWREQNGKTSGDGLEWLEVGEKYRPDSPYWKYMEIRQRREDAEDQLEQYKKLKKAAKQAQNVLVFNVRTPVTKAEQHILQTYAKLVHRRDPVRVAKYKATARAYTALHKQELREKAKERQQRRQYNGKAK